MSAFSTTSSTRAVVGVRSSRLARAGLQSSRGVVVVAPPRAIVSDTVKGEHAEQYAELASLLENYQYSYKVGDKVHGKVVACDTKGALVEIGAKADALVPTSECSLSAVKNVRVSCLMGFFITRSCDRVRRVRDDDDHRRQSVSHFSDATIAWGLGV